MEPQSYPKWKGENVLAPWYLSIQGPQSYPKWNPVFSLGERGELTLLQQQYGCPPPFQGETFSQLKIRNPLKKRGGATNFASKQLP